MKCSVCKGEGKQSVVAKLLTDRGWEDQPAVVMDCMTCEGTGEVSEQRQKELDYYQSIWCRCKKDYGVDFYDDDEHPDLSKHHYRCKKCGKVVQIG